MPGISVLYMVLSFSEYTRNKMLFVNSGVDPDRFALPLLLTPSDVARFCQRFDAYALTNDSDFFVYPIKGVISLDSIIRNFQRESGSVTRNSCIALSLVPKSVQVYSLRSILSYHQLSYEAYLFSVILQGNDFVEKIQVELPSSRRKRSFGDVLTFTKNLKGEDSRSFYAQSYANLNPKRTAEEVFLD